MQAVPDTPFPQAGTAPRHLGVAGPQGHPGPGRRGGWLRPGWLRRLVWPGQPGPMRRLPGAWIGLALLACAGWASPPAQAQAPAQAQGCGAPETAALGGAYRTEAGAVLSVLPAGAPGQWRITHFDSGRSHRLHPDSATRFHSAADFDAAQPVAYRYAFQLGPGGRAEALAIEAPTAAPVHAARLALAERPAQIRSGDIGLQGRLTLPAARRGPAKAVVFVHGSDPVPSIGLEWLPHLLAAQGIATLVFDKRGTGCSGGQYVQHFGLLSDDVVAAVRWLQAQPEIDPGQIGLAGFSQGGWVAPLAALKEPAIRFVAVGYGLAMSMADEDRLEAPLKLKALGADDAAVAEFEQLNAALHTLAREGFQDWTGFERQLQQARTRPWFAMAAQQPSWLGQTLAMGIEQAKRQAPAMFEHFFQPFYDPVPTLQALQIPMLWLIAGQDIEAPPGPTLEVLQRLRRQGQPITVTVFPNADHGMREVTLRDGQRVPMHYAPAYFDTLLRWLQHPR